MLSTRGIPIPVADFGVVLAVGVDVSGVFDEFVRHGLFEVVAGGAELREAVDDVADEMETIEFVLHPHVEGRGDCPFFNVAAHVQISVGPAVGESVDQARVAVEGEDDVLVGGE